MEDNVLTFCKKLRKLHLCNSIQNKISFGFCRLISCKEIPDVIIKLCWLYALPTDIFVLSFNLIEYTMSPYSIYNTYYSKHSTNVKMYNDHYLFETKEIVVNTSLLNQHWCFKLDRCNFNTDILFGFIRNTTNWQKDIFFFQKFSTYSLSSSSSSSNSLVTTRDIIHIYSIASILGLKIYFVINDKLEMIRVIRNVQVKQYKLVVGLTSETSIKDIISVSMIAYNLFNNVCDILKKFK